MTSVQLDAKARRLGAMLVRDHNEDVPHDELVALLAERRDNLRAGAGVTAREAIRCMDEPTLGRVAAWLARDRRDDRDDRDAWEGPADTAVSACDAAAAAVLLGAALLARSGPRDRRRSRDELLAVGCMTELCRAVAVAGAATPRAPRTGLDLAAALVRRLRAS